MQIPKDHKQLTSMTIISIKQETDGESRRIELSDGSVFSFMPCYLPEINNDESLCYNFFTPGNCEGREINANEEEGLRHAAACMRAERAALKLIARAEQSSAGLSLKLGKRGHDSVCIQKALSRLLELRLVDDARYVRLWLESRLNRRADSPRRLLSRLYSRGIDRDLAESRVRAALDAEVELDLLKRHVQKLRKRKNYEKIINRNTAEPERSLKYYLKGEGFSPQAIELFVEQEC